MREYSLKFSQLSIYVSTMVADSRAKIKKFVMVIFDLVVNECRLVMLIPSMYISHLIFHFKQIEEKNLKQVCRDLKRTRSKMGIIPRHD